MASNDLLRFLRRVFATPSNETSQVMRSMMHYAAACIGLIVMLQLMTGKWSIPRWMRSRRGNKRYIRMNEHESTLAKSLIVPSEINVTFDDIGGLDDVKRELNESLIFPFLHPEFFPATSIRQPPKGVLLYGPPGTGKTLIAKAIAKECDANFLNIPIEQLSQYYFGESEKMVTAVFTLARKLAPCIVFLDELESMFNKHIRTSPHSHEVHKKQLSIFLSMWDGFTNRDEAEGCQVIVVATTNLPSVLDDAVMRRLPLRLHVGLPHDAERLHILRIILKKEVLADGFDWELVVRKTKGYSGSDIRELCKKAAVYPMRDHIETYSKLQKYIQQLKSSNEFRSLQENSLDYKRKLIETTNAWLRSLPNSDNVVQKRIAKAVNNKVRPQRGWWRWLSYDMRRMNEETLPSDVEELELKMRPLHHDDFVQACTIIKPSTSANVAASISVDLD